MENKFELQSVEKCTKKNQFINPVECGLSQKKIFISIYYHGLTQLIVFASDWFGFFLLHKRKKIQ